MSRRNDITRHIINAVRNGYSGALPTDTCRCGGIIRVTHTLVEKGGWVLRRLACGQCGRKHGKWSVADSLLSDSTKAGD